jgi:hypothetical protein
MQRVTLVRYTAKPDRAAENEKLSRAVFAQLRNASSEGIVDRCEQLSGFSPRPRLYQ